VRSFAFDALHELIADYGPAAAGGSSPAALQLALDGTRLWELPTSLRRIARRFSLGELSVGWNLAEDPTCTERFSGSIESVRASSAQALDSLRWPNSPPDGSEFELGIRFSTAVGSEPLLSTGREGSSDVIIAERSAPGSVSIGLAHGDLLPVYGTPLDIDDGAFHRILVRVGPFFAHDPGLFPKDRVSVQIDGRQALYLQEELYPFAPHEVHFLDNPLGNTRCKRDFGGEIREVVTRESPVSGNALRTIIRGGHGAITFLVRLDGNNITRGMGLVETGRPGAGDVLSVTRTDARHVRFSFDHWGLGGPTGPILEVDPATPHVITVDMDSLHAGAGQNPKEEVKVTLDGAMALSGHSACYPCDPEEIYLLQNKFNSSGVSGPFDGSCLSVSRAP